MKTKLVALAAALVLSGAMATTADAVHPVRGDQYMVADLSGQCEDLAWYGTLDIDGDVYGMALYFTEVESVQRGNSYHYEEGFKVFTGLLDSDGDGLVDDCEPGEVVMSGFDKGSASLVNLKFHSMGTADTASGPFEGWEGRKVYQDGVITDFLILPDLPPIPAAFVGSLRLN